MGYVNYYKTDLGIVGIAEANEKITHLFFDGENFITKVSGRIPEPYSQKETPLLAEAGKQLNEYFKGQRKEFDLPLAPVGTEFQQRVWASLQTIPYGETRSYKDIAILAGNEKACRAVGMANNRNPISIIIPCHRVIGASGGLVGYGGGLDKKVFLLDLERTNGAVHL